MRLHEIRNTDTETLISWIHSVIVPRMEQVRIQPKEGKLILSYRNQITRDLAIIIIDIHQQIMNDPDDYSLGEQSYTDERSFKQSLYRIVKSAEDIE